jgi:O-antigen ligase/tetratricopeptide (TPR) repeat protein
MTEKLVKAVDYTILAVLGLVVAVSLLYPPFSKPGLTLIYESALVGAGFLFIMSHKLLKEELKIETPIDGNLFMLFAWSVISVVFSKSMFGSLNSAVTFCIMLLFFYITYNYAKKHFTRFLIFLTGVSVLLCLYGLYQYFFGFADTLKYISMQATGHLQAITERLVSRRVFSTFIYPNTFAGFLILMIPVALGLFKSERRYRPYLMAALVLMVANLILTKSVGAFISLIIATLIVLIFVNDATLTNFRRLFIIMLAVCVALLFVVLQMRGFSMFGEGVQAKFESYYKMLGIIKKFFLYGTGQGTFEDIYNSAAFGKSNYLKYAHNFILQAAIESGVIGLALFAAAGFKAYSSVIQNFYFIRTPRRKVLVFSLLISLTASLIHNLVDFDIYNFEICIVFLVLLAALMSQINIGMIQLKKIKLSYLLGLSPGKRRTIIFYCVMSALALSVVTGGRQVYVLCIINTLIAAGFAIWSVSKEDLRRTDVDLPILLLLAWFGISLFITPDFYQGVFYLSMILGAVVLYYLSSQFLRRYQFRISITHFIIYTGFALSLVACGQYLFRFFKGAFPVADAFFPNQDLFAAYMSVPFSLLLSKLLFEKNIRLMAPKISMLVLMAVSASLAHSKSGMLTLIFVFVCVWIYYRSHRDGVKDMPAQVSFKSRMMACLLIVLAAMSFTPITPSGEKMLSVRQDPFYFNRLDIYKASLRMALANPIAGSGIGSYEKIFPAFNFPIDSPARYQKETPFAHNEALQTAATTGFTGLALLLLLFVALMNNTPSYEGHKKLWAAKAGAYFGVAGILFHSMFYFTLHVPGILFTIAVLASVFAAEKYSIKTVSKEALLFTKIYYFPALIFAFILFSFVIRPAAGSFLFDRYRHTARYDYLAQASLAEPFNASYQYERGFYFEQSGNLRAAVPFFENALKYDRLNYIYRLHLARAYAGLGDITAAIKNYNMAIAANPYRAFTFAEFSDFYTGVLNDRENAEKLLTQALAIEPDYTGAMANLAVLYWSEKKYSAALKNYDSIIDIISVYTPLNSYEKTLLYAPAAGIFMNRALLLKDMNRKKESCADYLSSLASGGRRSAALDNYCGKPGTK